MDSGHPVYYHTTQCPPTTQDSVCEMCNCVSIIQDTARVSYNYQFMCLHLPLWSRVEAELYCRSAVFLTRDGRQLVPSSVTGRYDTRKSEEARKSRLGSLLKTNGRTLNVALFSDSFHKQRPYCFLGPPEKSLRRDKDYACFARHILAHLASMF